MDPKRSRSLNHRRVPCAATLLAAAFGVSAQPAWAQTFSPAASPNPLTLALGGPGATVVVTTNPDPGFLEPVTFSFVGLPGFIQHDGPKMALPPYPPVPFAFGLGPGAVSGTFNGTLRGVTAVKTVEVPFQVIVPPGPSFTASASPNPLTLALGGPGAGVTVTTAPDPGFSAPITYSFTGLPGFIQNDGPRTAQPPYPPVSFAFGLGPGAVSGTYNGTLRGVSAAATVKVPFQVIVPTAPSFTASASPNPLPLALGEAGAAVTVTTAPEPGFSAPITYSFTGLPVFIRNDGPKVASAPYGPLAFGFALGSGARAGAFTGRLRGAGGAATVEIPFRVVVGAAPSFTVAVSPNPVELAIGGAPVPVRVTTTAGPGFAEPITYGLRGLPAFVQSGGSQVASPPAYAPLTFPLSLAPGAVAGTHAGVLEVRVRGAVERAIPFTAVVRPPLPIIDRAVPATLAAGGRAQEVRLLGRNFEPGAAVAVDSPAVTVESVSVVSAGLARVKLAVRPDAPAGPVRLTLTNPGGGTTPVGGLVVVLPADSLAAPLSVTAAVIVFPRPGTQIARGEAVYPKGLLTVTGGGPILGSWRVDGVAFDRFAVQAVAGLPVAVESRVPIPQLGLGDHRLVLEVTHPQQVASPEVTFVQTVERASGLRALAPEERAVAGGRPLLFEWSLVPGATAYEVEIERRAPGALVTRETAETHWRPDERAWAELGAGVVRWRVRALFPGGVRGEPTGWRELALLPGEELREPGAAGVRFASGVSRLAAEAPWEMVEEEEAPPAQEPAEPAFVGLFNAELSAGAGGGDEPREPEEGRLALSGQGNARRPSGAAQATADLSWQRLLEGEGPTEQESENWLASAEARAGPAAGGIGAGYGGPTFLTGLEFLDGGLARGGAEASLGAPGWLRFAAYDSFDAELGEAAGGLFAVDQDLRAATLELGGEERPVLLRAVGMEVAQEATDFDAGGDGRSFGLFGRVRLGSGLTLVVEGARGEFEPGPESFEEAREGDAYRLGLEGGAGAFTYSLDLRHVEAGFVNPANRGLTPGGRSDRDVVELQVARASTRSSFQAQLQHLEGGDGFGPPGTVDAVRFDASRSLGASLRLALGGNFAATRADADPDLFLPETDGRDWGLTASATETLGSLQLTQSAAVQIQEDRDEPTADLTTSTAALSAFAAAGGFSLSASLTGTRVEADPTAGRTDTVVLSLQPSWEIAAASLRFLPWLTYTAVTNDLLDLDATTEQYLVTVAWNPPWLGSLLALEVTAEASRTRDGFAEDDGDFAQRYLVTLVLRRGGEATRPRPTTSPPAPPPSMPGDPRPPGAGGIDRRGGG